MTKERSVLTWKYEDGDGAADADVGPAWIASSDGESEEVNGGKWLTRAEARALAQQDGHEFFEDDGSAPKIQVPDAHGAGLDVDEINRKLRAAGISEAELRIEENAGFNDVLVWGTMLRLLPAYARDADSPYRTAMVSMHPDELWTALDHLVPEWRSVN